MLPADAVKFARSWLTTWSNITCLPNFATDVKGRVILDLLNEPDLVLNGRGLHWQRCVLRWARSLGLGVQ